MKGASPRFTAAHASRLAAFLAAPERPEDTFSYCEVAGFLFAVACSPDLVQPSEWLPVIFNEREAGFATLSEAQEILPMLTHLYNYINAGVLNRKPKLPVGCKVLADPIANLTPEATLSQWARGFAAGSGWLEVSWDEYAPDEFDEELGATMMVLSFFASRELAISYRMEMKRRDTSLDELAAEMLGLFKEAMRSYAIMGRAIYETVHSGNKP